MKQKLYTYIVIFLTLLILFSCGGENPPAENGTDNTTNIGATEDDKNESTGTESGDNNDNESSSNGSGSNSENENDSNSQNGSPENGDSNNDGNNQESEIELIVFAQDGERSSTYIVCPGGDYLYTLSLDIQKTITDTISATLVAKPYEIYGYNPENDGQELIIGITDRAGANGAIEEYTKDFSGEFFCFIQYENDLIFYASSTVAYELGKEKFPDIFLKNVEFSAEIGYKYHEFLEN